MYIEGNVPYVSQNSSGFGNGWEGLIGLALVAGLFDGGFGSFGGGNRGASADAAIQRGFDNQTVVNKLNGLENGLCDGFYAVNTAFGTLNTTLCQGFSGINQSIYQSGTDTRFAINDLGYRLQDCCCQTQRAIDGVNYNLAKSTCDIIRAGQDNTSRIIDYLTQEKICSLEADKAALTAQLSQNSQTATLLNAINKTPVPSYTVPNPYYYGPYGYGA